MTGRARLARRPAAVLTSAARRTGAAVAGISAVTAASAAFSVAAPDHAAALPGKSHGTPLPYQVLRRDVIINADMWAEKPEMMAAGLGFTTIIGVPDLSTSNLALSKTMTLLAGGTWNTVHCAAGETPTLSNYTSAAPLSGTKQLYGQDIYYSDGLPVEFSWPDPAEHP